VAGFTKIAESLEPAKLSQLLNHYLSPMTEIIMAREGYVDKYAGDGIMAEWGVPYPSKDHAVQACLAALEQQKKLAEIRSALKEESGFDVTVRMGINTGSVTAGNMGSNRRFQYTVMGDSVNQASRFEPANKEYGTQIIIGETTYAGAKEHLETRLLDKIVVVGKTKPIEIYELIARKGEITEQKRNVVSLYEKALRLHWGRQWDESLSCLADALGLDPEDGPCVRLRDVVASYKESPPPDSWEGEYVRKSKD
jgi:adenylate cyclase